MKYRMLALDLDGTFFDSTGVAPKANLEAVQRARDAGMLIVVCTGRGLKESKPAIEQLGHFDPMVRANGSLISDPTTGKTLHRAMLEPHLSRPAIEYLQAGGDAVLCLLDPGEVEHDYLIVNPDRVTENTKWWFDYVGARYRGVDAVSEEDLHHVLRVGIVGPPDRMPPVEAGLMQQFGPENIFVQHFTAVKDPETGEEVHILEVFASGVSKWSGLVWMAREHGIDPSQIVAIGDHINDLAMIENAGCGIAMANAVDSVHKVARYRTQSNDEAGVAHAIEQILAGRW
jgi:hypothetical protein